MRQNSDGMSTGMAVVCTLGILILIGLIIGSNEPKCIRSGCDRDAKDGSSYCYLHDHPTYNTGSYRSTSTGSSTTSNRNSGSSGGSSRINANSGTQNSSSNSHTSNRYSTSTDSYDDGYNDVYEDDDYDWDRYRNDSDYADGVDDAMEDEDW